MGSLVAVNVGVLRTEEWAGDMGRTGIDKRPAAQRVRATRLGLAGDHVVDTRHHGGFDQALYAYAQEDAAWWAAELSRGQEPGNFGENLTTEGVAVTDAVIGERWEVAGTVLEVSCPRIPCRVFAGFWGVPDLIKRFTAHGAPGAYLRVIVEGDLGAGDPVRVAHRPGHGVTIGEVFRALTTEPALLPRLLDVPELPQKQREVVQRRLRPAAAR
ncbi:MAG TPA: MOSC domain-containing protein [Micromonosporaceae bacterium]